MAFGIIIDKNKQHKITALDNPNMREIQKLGKEYIKMRDLDGVRRASSELKSEADKLLKPKQIKSEVSAQIAHEIAQGLIKIKRGAK
jgi:hypothetical protein